MDQSVVWPAFNPSTRKQRQKEDPLRPAWTTYKILSYSSDNEGRKRSEERNGLTHSWAQIPPIWNQNMPCAQDIFHLHPQTGGDVWFTSEQCSSFLSSGCVSLSAPILTAQSGSCFPNSADGWSRKGLLNLVYFNLHVERCNLWIYFIQCSWLNWTKSGRKSTQSEWQTPIHLWGWIKKLLLISSLLVWS